MNEKLTSACGMNCMLCVNHLKDKNKCLGCRSGRKLKGKIIKCGIEICKFRNGDFCYNCDKFPCDRIKRMDKRYRDKYEMSVIDNLMDIKTKGIKCFLQQENKKWVNEDGVYCVHTKVKHPLP